MHNFSDVNIYLFIGFLQGIIMTIINCNYYQNTKILYLTANLVKGFSWNSHYDHIIILKEIYLKTILFILYFLLFNLI